MKAQQGLSASTAGWKDRTILSVGSSLSQRSCLPGLFTWLNGNVKDAPGETLGLIHSLGAPAQDL